MKWAILSIVSILIFGFVGIIIYQHYSLDKSDKLLEGNIAISKDDQYIAFAYQKDGKPAIYVAKSDGTNAKKIINLNSKTTEGNIGPFINFNPDDSKLLVRDYNVVDRKTISDLEIIDLKSEDIKIIPTPGILVKEAIFALDGKTIYFLGNEYFSSSNPRGDIYPTRINNVFSINTDGSDLKKITNYKSEMINNLNISTNGKLLTAHIPVGGKIILVPTDDPKNIKSTELPIVENINKYTSGNGPSLIYDVIFTPNNKSVIFTRDNIHTTGDSGERYDLFRFDLDTKQTTQLTDLKSNVINPIFFNTQNKILFLQQTTNPYLYQLIKVTTDGTDLQKINLSVE